MKNMIAGIVVFFLSLFIYTKIVGPFQLSVNSITTNKSDNFTVTGEGKATSQPDLAVVNAGFSVQAPTVDAAKNQLNQVMDKLSASVKQLGISSNDLQTTNYNINPNYDFRSSDKHITGYQASANLQIKIHDLTKANTVLDAVTASGANQVGGLTFEVSDKTKAENEARQIAVAQAKKTAEEAARIAGFTLGRVVNYSENFGAGFPPPTLMKADAMERVAGVPTQVEPGTNEVAVTVYLSYEIR